MIYRNVLEESIRREKASSDYTYSREDRLHFLEMISKINKECNSNVQYLAELDALIIAGAGSIIADYIDSFSSESIKAYLIPQMLSDKIQDCDRIVLRMYRHFQMSDEFISAPGKPSPAHIYVRYDGAFRKLRSKRIKDELMEIVSRPRDAFYLPFTTKMLASWKMPELQEVLLHYLMPNAILMCDVGIEDNGNTYYPSYSHICRELRFTAINALAHYPSTETHVALYSCMSDADNDIRLAAKRVYEKMTRGQGDGSVVP